MASVQKTDGCWLWTGALVRGYGRTSVNGKATPAHRAVYELLVGPVPADLHLDHLCKVRRCVRPDHLDPVTPATNNDRSDSPSAMNSRKDRCDRGHEFTPTNTYRPPSGRRVCRICRNAWMREARRRARSTCKHGHHLAPDNVRVKANGTRMCLTCMAQRARGGLHDSRFARDTA